METTVMTSEINQQAKIFVAGHRGLVGSAIVRNLQSKGYDNIVTRSRDSLDLMDRSAVDLFYAQEKPDIVIDAAAKGNRSHPIAQIH